MADVNGRGLVVYNKNRLFRLEAQVFEPIKQYARVSIAGVNFELEDSLMGMAVTPSIFKNEGRDLIFRPFSSRAVYTADTRVLARSIYGNTIKYKSSLDMLPSQATAMGISSQGTLFFGLTQEIAIGCWNRYRTMSKDNVVSIHFFFVLIKILLFIFDDLYTFENDESYVIFNQLTDD